MRITRTEHTRRAFLLAVAGGAAGAATGAVLPASAALAAADTFEVNLLGLGVAPEAYTTQWPTGANRTVMVWDAAFRAAHAALAAHGGGRLIVPGNSDVYYLRYCQVFDLPSVTVQLAAGAEVMMVGLKNPAVGGPIGFYGGMGDGTPPRQQRDFAALIGPGKVGFPAAQLEYYDRGNAVGFSYVKTALVEGVEVPCAPRYAMTAQYGCAEVTYRGNRIGYTGTPGEITLGGHAVLNVTGGLYDDATGTEYPGWLRSTVVIENNTIGHGSRALYAEQCGLVSVLGNTFGPMDGVGVTIADCVGATVGGNTFQQVSRGGPGGDAIQLVDVADPISVHHNTVLGRTHRNCVLSRDTTDNWLRSGVVHSRSNRWNKGAAAVFGGAPAWDSVGDTVS